MYIVTLEIRMGMINAVIKNAHDDTLTRNSFTPYWNNVDVIANSTTGLTVIELNTNKIVGLLAEENKQIGVFQWQK